MIGEFCRWRWTIGEFAQESRLALLVAIFSELWPIRFRIALLVKGLQLSTDWWRFSRCSTLGMCTCGFVSQSIQNLTNKNHVSPTKERYQADLAQPSTAISWLCEQNNVLYNRTDGKRRFLYCAPKSKNLVHYH
jgi:hypothetical protein